MTPETASVGESTQVEIQGSNFFLAIVADFRSQSGSSIDDEFEAMLGGQRLLDVSYVDSGTLTAVVPPLPMPGTLDLTVTDPNGRTGTLPSAFTIVLVSGTDGGGTDGGGDDRIPGDSPGDSPPLGDPAGDPIGPGDPPPTATPIGTFSDNFGDGVIGPEWLVSTTSGCTVSEPSGRVQFQTDGSTASRCNLTTTSPYDLTGGAAIVDIPPITNFYPELWVFLEVTNAAGDRMEFGFQSDAMHARVFVGGSEVFSQASGYSPRPRYWRIREQAGDIYFETSVNGSAWDLGSQTNQRFPVTRVWLSFGVQTSGPMSGSVGIGVPSFGIAP